MSSVHLDVEPRVKRKKAGALIFPADFRGAGSGAAVKMALGRSCGSVMAFILFLKRIRFLVC